MAKAGFLSDVFSKDLLWAGAGGATAWGGYYLVGRLMPTAVEDADKTKAIIKQIVVSTAVGFGGAYVASEVVKTPKGFAAGMAGMAGTLSAVALLLFLRDRSGAQAGINYLPGPRGVPRPAPDSVSYGLDGGRRHLLAGTGISTMGNVSEVRVRENPSYVPARTQRGANGLREWW